ncbi:MAG: hypothetical protein LBL73_08780 [Synergistaceae bacterium]|jgi:hypothetical protein|nr:hypothetical protein [Synergistaceae bacterium]
MKKVFVSQPMRGKTDEEILAERKRLETMVKDAFGDDAEILDSFFKDFDGNALQFLGKSIGVLAEADGAVFGAGWENARGCRIEHACCEEYGIKVLAICSGPGGLNKPSYCTTGGA